LRCVGARNGKEDEEDDDDRAARKVFSSLSLQWVQRKTLCQSGGVCAQLRLKKRENFQLLLLNCRRMLEERWVLRERESSKKFK